MAHKTRVSKNKKERNEYKVFQHAFITLYSFLQYEVGKIMLDVPRNLRITFKANANKWTRVLKRKRTEKVPGRPQSVETVSIFDGGDVSEQQYETIY